MAQERGQEEVLVNPLHESVVERMDPQFAAIYTKYQAPRLRADQVTYAEYNSNRSLYTFSIASGPSPEVGDITLYDIPVSSPPGSIKIQVYRPKAKARNGTERLPAHVNYHGGGWVIGNLKSDEPWCRQVCEAVGCIIVNVDYRLAPDFPHPTPLLDSWEALKHVFAHAEELGIDAQRISIGGLSAGGQIAASLAILARDQKEELNLSPLVLQLLIVPAVDARWIPVQGSCDPAVVPYESYVVNEFAPCLPLQRLRWFYNLWLGTDLEKRKESASHFYASPILAPSHANLAPASIHVAGVDTLTSEGIAYHETLTTAGTKSKLKVYEGVGHPFGHWDGELDKAKEYVRDTIQALKGAYGIE
ncbi:alpha beta hydrolase fold protein [Phlyctema vagabunda]|uniref:Alpha beta hydrolase fold protein n=1 Tax=Phlyctema vagabunda TaxID=108571 RepID=A0ABR4P278_9HELO